MPFILLLFLGCAGSRGGDSVAPPDDTALLHSQATPGGSCDPVERAGWIALSRTDDQLTLSGVINDAPEPLTGRPEISNEHCAYHRYDSSGCPPCNSGLICGGDGSCTTAPVAFGDLVVLASAGGGTTRIEADSTTGLVYQQLGDPDLEWTLDLAFGPDRVSAPAMPVASGDIGISVQIEGSSESPGALEASWTPSDDGSAVRTVVPINHHAQPGTFTFCQADAALGSFRADAEMIEPLAVVTGLEFQGIEHWRLAAAQTSVGCVELRYGRSLYLDPSFTE